MTQPPYPPAGAPAGYANSDEKTWALIAHFGGALFGFLAPLVALLVKGQQSPTVRAHAVAALNFQIVGWITLVGLSILRACGGFFLPDILGMLLGLVWFGVWVAVVVFAVIAGIRANSGQLYRYPIQVSLVK